MSSLKSLLTGNPHHKNRETEAKPAPDGMHTQENGLMLRMVISYSVFLLVILVLFFYLYRSTFDNARDLYNMQHKSSTVNDIELFEKDLDFLKTYGQQLLQSPSLRLLMSKSERDEDFYELTRTAQSLMAADLYPQSILPIRGVFCYFPATDYIITPNENMDRAQYYSSVLQFAAEQETSWMSYVTDEAYHCRFLPLDVSSGEADEDISFLYALQPDIAYYEDSTAVVCYTLSYDTLSTIFGGIGDTVNDNMCDFVIAIRSEDQTEVLRLVSERAYKLQTADLTGLDCGDDLAVLELNGQEINIACYVSDVTGYTYYYGFAAYGSTQAVTRYSIVFTAVFLLSLLFGGALILSLSRRNMKPILQLGRELDQAQAERTQLQSQVDSQRPIISSSYVRQLLMGAVPEGELETVREYLGLKASGLVYNVLYVCTYRNFDADIIRGAISDYLGELPCYFSARERTYSLLLSCPASEGAELLMRLNSQILHLHEHLLDTRDIWLYAGLGRNTDELSQVWECYRQAVEAASYTYRNYILYPYEFLKKDANAFYYPPELSAKLVRLITTGSTEQVAEIFETLHRENMEKRSLPVQMLRYLLSEIRNTLLRARFTLPESTDTASIAALDEQFGAQLTFQICEDLALELCRLFSGGNKKEENLATTIEKYIQEHFSDPSLGLVKISDEFGISKTYFSHMFKEKTGVNFSTYLENVRMSEATRLIRERDTGLNELYLAVGYTNPATFRRAFKKVYGVTPSEFSRN